MGDVILAGSQDILGGMTATIAVPPHPARFSDPILGVIGPIIEEESNRIGRAVRLLDPFAGVGGVHRLDPNGDPVRPGFGTNNDWIDTVGVELEAEWAYQHPWTLVGDATALPFRDGSFDVVVTSPTYGNRMADHHNAKDGTKRVTYRHTLGRALTPGNSGEMHWGEDYRMLHRRAWQEVERVLRPSGLFVLNVSNHIRKGEEVPVVEWHRDTLLDMGYTVSKDIEVRTARMGFGANHAARVGFEHVLCLRRS